MAAYGFKGVGWFLCGVIVAPGCYLVTSQVAAERAELAQVEAAIVAAHKDIRDLETEFTTRANMAQLARWNGDSLKMAAPNPDQFLADPMALASFDPTMGEGALQQASLVVPTGVDRQAPVQTAALETRPHATTQSAPNAAPQPAAHTATKPAPAPVAAPAPRASRPARVDGPVRLASADGNGSTRAMAMLEDGLLSAETLASLRDRARTERLALQ